MVGWTAKGLFATCLVVLLASFADQGDRFWTYWIKGRSMGGSHLVNEVEGERQSVRIRMRLKS